MKNHEHFAQDGLPRGLSLGLSCGDMRRPHDGRNLSHEACPVGLQLCSLSTRVWFSKVLVRTGMRKEDEQVITKPSVTMVAGIKPRACRRA